MQIRHARAFIVILGAISASSCSNSNQPAATKASSSTAAAPTAAPLPTGPRLFVTNEVGGDMTVIDIGTQKAIATIPRGFYLRASFTSEILRQNYAL